MDHMCKLLDVAPECESANGLLYIILDGKRCFAYPPHIARITNERIKRALDKMDADNAKKVCNWKR